MGVLSPQMDCICLDSHERSWLQLLNSSLLLLSNCCCTYFLKTTKLPWLKLEGFWRSQHPGEVLCKLCFVFCCREEEKDERFMSLRQKDCHLWPFSRGRAEKEKTPTIQESKESRRTFCRERVFLHYQLQRLERVATRQLSDVIPSTTHSTKVVLIPLSSALTNTVGWSRDISIRSCLEVFRRSKTTVTI